MDFKLFSVLLLEVNIGQCDSNFMELSKTRYNSEIDADGYRL